MPAIAQRNERRARDVPQLILAHSGESQVAIRNIAETHISKPSRQFHAYPRRLPHGGARAEEFGALEVRAPEIWRARQAPLAGEIFIAAASAIMANEGSKIYSRKCKQAPDFSILLDEVPFLSTTVLKPRTRLKRLRTAVTRCTLRF